MKKNMLLKRRAKRLLVWEFLVPALTGGFLRWFASRFDCALYPQPTEEELEEGRPKTCEPVIMAMARNLLLPFLFVVYVPNLTQLSSKFILQTMVDDK